MPHVFVAGCPVESVLKEIQDGLERHAAAQLDIDGTTNGVLISPPDAIIPVTAGRNASSGELMDARTSRKL